MPCTSPSIFAVYPLTVSNTFVGHRRLGDPCRAARSGCLVLDLIRASASSRLDWGRWKTRQERIDAYQFRAAPSACSYSRRRHSPRERVGRPGTARIEGGTQPKTDLVSESPTCFVARDQGHCGATAQLLRDGWITNLESFAVDAQVWSWRMKSGGAVGRGGSARRKYWALRRGRKDMTRTEAWRAWA